MTAMTQFKELCRIKIGKCSVLYVFICLCVCMCVCELLSQFFLCVYACVEFPLFQQQSLFLTLSQIHIRHQHNSAFAFSNQGGVVGERVAGVVHCLLTSSGVLHTNRSLLHNSPHCHTASPATSTSIHVFTFLPSLHIHCSCLRVVFFVFCSPHGALLAIVSRTQCLLLGKCRSL